jgi:hypothetical protein
MRQSLANVLAFSLGGALLSFAAGAATAPLPAGAGQDQSSFQAYTDEQLDNLLAPIALYPDPLLAQVLVAATFPDEIDDAARYVRSYSQNGVDNQSWDVSVRAIAHYPAVLNMMDENLDWTTAVGQAYVYQSTDVMTSIQRLRGMAQAQGNLVNTPQQQVVDENGEIGIWPASPEYIYVPVYDPSIVFFRPAYSRGTFIGFSFGSAFRIGVWLNLDCDWGHHRVYYTGWQGGGWIERSRPHIVINNIYVNRRYTNITINRTVIERPVNYQGLGRFQGVHRDIGFQNRARAGQPPASPAANRVPNKMINRNIPPNQPLEQFRGWQQQQPAPARSARPMPQQPEPRNVPTAERPANRPQPARNFPQVRPPTPAPAQPAPEARPPNAFGRGDSAFNTREASQRGQQSRQQMNQKPARTPAPKPKNEQRPRNRGGR